VTDDAGTIVSLGNALITREISDLSDSGLVRPRTEMGKDLTSLSKTDESILVSAIDCD
jgi:hypothetical protein